MANVFEDIARLSAQITKTQDADARARMTNELRTLTERLPRGTGHRQAEFDTSGAYDPPGTRRAPLNVKTILQRPSRNPEEAELALFNDHAAILSSCLRRPIQETRFYQERLDESPWLQKTMDTTSGSGWIPTEISSDLIRQARLDTVVLQQFRQVAMTTPVMKLPLQGDPPTAHLVGEVSGPDDELDPTKRVPATDLGIGTAATLTAKKCAVRVVPSVELTEDAVVPVLDLIRSEIATALAQAAENAIINAKRVGTLDSDVSTSNDVRHWFDGLRQNATGASLGNNTAVFQVATAGRIALNDLRKMRARLGRYGINPSECFFLTGPAGYTQLMGLTDSLGNPLVVTREKFGNDATLVKGSIAALDGFGIVLSQFVREDLYSGSGLQDGITQDSTMVLLVNKSQFIWGDHRGISLKSRENIDVDTLSLVAMQRSDFVNARPVPSAAGVPVGYLYGVKETT